MSGENEMGAMFCSDARTQVSQGWTGRGLHAAAVQAVMAVNRQRRRRDVALLVSPRRGG